jgi:uncharacterized protein YjbI with pentapeptide repeats
MDPLQRLQNETDFSDQVFEGLDLTGFVFRGKEFDGCTFRRSKLSASVWAGARLEDCSFEDCDLTQMKPGDVGAHGVRFVRCKLMGTTWEKPAPACQIGFEECNLQYASFVSAHLRKTAFVNCRATEVNFVDSDLRDADFAGTDLTAANFQNSDLRNADLSTAEGAFVDPTKNRVRGLRISNQGAALLAMSFGMRVKGYGRD